MDESCLGLVSEARSYNCGYICLEIGFYYLINWVETRSKADDLRFSCKTSELPRAPLHSFGAQPGRGTAEVKATNHIFPASSRVGGG